jgi:hypothetical protein
MFEWSGTVLDQGPIGLITLTPEEFNAAKGNFDLKDMRYI